MWEEERREEEKVPTFNCVVSGRTRTVLKAMSKTLVESVDDAAEDDDSVEFVKCECCGLTEECTVEYIAVVRERHHGRWICGLCAEAVKDEICRSEMLITTEEALDRHTTFRSSPSPGNPTGHLISAVRQIVRRSFESPHAQRPMTSSPRRKSGEVVVARSSFSKPGNNCFSTLAR